MLIKSSSATPGRDRDALRDSSFRIHLAGDATHICDILGRPRLGGRICRANELS